MPASGDLVGPPILIIAGLVVMAVFAVLAVRFGYTRTRMKPPPPSSTRSRPEASSSVSVEPADTALWAVRSRDGGIERAARNTAVAWASQDLLEETEVLRSTDHGATWDVVPRAEWRKGMTRP